MEKRELAKQILSLLDGAEWEQLENGTSDVPVSPFNREVLLRVRDREYEYSGIADSRLADSIRAEVGTYLEEHWPEAPEAHKYVVGACLALRLLEGKPMHPPDVVQYYTVVWDGKAEYYCPTREDGPVCRLCLARDMEELYAVWEKRTRETAGRYGELSGLIQMELFRAGFTDSGVIETEKLIFHEEVRKCCEENRCGAFGTSWACPPGVGTLPECRERVLGYGKMMLFSRAYLLPDGMDFDGMKEAMAYFRRMVISLKKKLSEIVSTAAVLSNESCGRCGACTFPNAPCRFPEDLCHSIEGYGFNVSELAKQAGIRYMNGKSTVTYFGAVLY